jgi:hypothetical protein
MFNTRIYSTLIKSHATNPRFEVEAVDRNSCKIEMACDDGKMPVTVHLSPDKLRMFFTVDPALFSVLDTNQRFAPDLNNGYIHAAYDRAWGKTMRVQANAYDYMQIKFILEHLTRTQSFVARPPQLEGREVYASA